MISGACGWPFWTRGGREYFGLTLNPEVYYLDHIPFATQPLDLVFVGTAALAISLLATIHPALKAAWLDPADALRYG